MAPTRSGLETIDSTSDGSEGEVWCQVRSRKCKLTHSGEDETVIARPSQAHLRNARRSRQRASRTAPPSSSSFKPIQEVSPRDCRQNREGAFAAEDREQWCYIEPRRAMARTRGPLTVTPSQLRNARRSQKRSARRSDKTLHATEDAEESPSSETDSSNEELANACLEDIAQSQEEPTNGQDQTTTLVVALPVSKIAADSQISDASHILGEAKGNVIHSELVVSLENTAFQQGTFAARDPKISKSTALPKTYLARCHQGYSGEQSGFSVPEGCFVHVWKKQRTSNGWVYAQEREDPSSRGWLPAAILQPLPLNNVWMCASKSCRLRFFDTQMSVAEGDMLLIDTTSPFLDGWCYARTPAVQDQNPCLRSGWVPAKCLE